MDAQGHNSEGGAPMSAEQMEKAMLNEIHFADYQIRDCASHFIKRVLARFTEPKGEQK